MKKLVYGILLLAIVGVGFVSCSKDEIVKNNDLLKSSTVEVWSATIQKEVFLARLSNEVSSDEYDAYAEIVQNKIKYLIVNNNGQFEEYLQLEKEGAFIQISSHEITSNSPSNSIVIESLSDELVINNNVLSGVTKLNDFDDIEISTEIPLWVCCKACYAVHDYLDIHIFDCLCCNFKCMYCFEPVIIVW